MRMFSGIDIAISGSVMVFCPQNQRTICAVKTQDAVNYANQQIYDIIADIINETVEITRITVDNDYSIASYLLRSNITLDAVEEIHQKVKKTFGKFQVTFMMANE